MLLKILFDFFRCRAQIAAGYWIQWLVDKIGDGLCCAGLSNTGRTLLGSAMIRFTKGTTGKRTVQEDDEALPFSSYQIQIVLSSCGMHALLPEMLLDLGLDNVPMGGWKHKTLKASAIISQHCILEAVNMNFNPVTRPKFVREQPISADGIIVISELQSLAVVLSRQLLEDGLLGDVVLHCRPVCVLVVYDHC
jgi:hypothetical protein